MRKQTGKANEKKSERDGIHGKNDGNRKVNQTKEIFKQTESTAKVRKQTNKSNEKNIETDGIHGKNEGNRRVNQTKKLSKYTESAAKLTEADG